MQRAVEINKDICQVLLFLFPFQRIHVPQFIVQNVPFIRHGPAKETARFLFQKWRLDYTYILYVQTIPGKVIQDFRIHEYSCFQPSVD